MVEQTVLLAEDDEALADLYAKYLDNHYNTKVVYNGKEAVKKLIAPWIYYWLIGICQAILAMTYLLMRERTGGMGLSFSSVGWLPVLLTICQLTIILKSRLIERN